VATWTPPSAYPAATMLPSSWLNEFVIGNTEFLSTPPMFRATKSLAQTITAGAGATIINCSPTSYDTVSGYANPIYTIQTGCAGYYDINATTNVTAAAGTVAWSFLVTQNGTQVGPGNNKETPSGQNDTGVIADCVYAAVGDTFYLAASCVSVNLTITIATTFAMKWRSF
jgi:hypothetical protein